MAAERPDAARPRRLRNAAKGRLRRPLAPEHISERRRDGEVIRYLEGWRAIQLANSIFGEDRWGSEVVGEIDYHPIPRTGHRNATPILGIYTATVRVTVDGCPPHSDVGTGIVDEQTAEGHATAAKAAVTDGLKRALRHYGPALGNELYGDDRDPDSPESRHDTEDLQRQVLEIGRQGGSDEEHTREWIAAKYGCPLDLLDRPRLVDAVARLSRGVDRRNGNQQAA